jgi:hypothetical protein
VGLSNRLNQETVVGIPGHDGRASPPAFQQRIARVDTKPAIPLIGMTVVAVRRKHRPNPGLEEVGRLRGCGWRLLRRRELESEQQSDKKQQPSVQSSSGSHQQYYYYATDDD